MDERIQELRDRLANSTDTATQGDIHVELSKALIDTAPEEAIGEAKRAFRIARLRKDPLAMATALVARGVAHERLSDHNAALTHLRKGLDLVRDEDAPDIVAQALQQIGIVKTNSGDVVAAIEVLDQALEKAAETGDELREASIHNSCGVAWFQIGHHGRALEHFQASHRTFETLNHKQGLLFANNNIGTIYLAIDEVGKAHDYFLKNVELMTGADLSTETLVHEINLATALVRMGEVKEGTKRAKRALKKSRTLRALAHESYLLHLLGGYVGSSAQRLSFLQQALDLAEKTGDPLRLSVSTSIGALLTRLGRHDEALSILLATLEETERVGDRQTLADIHSVLAGLYEQIDNAGLALHHHKIFTQLSSEIHGQDQQRRIAEMEMRSQIERAERDREILRLEKVRLEQEMAHKTSELTAMALNLIEKNQFLKSLKGDLARTAQESGADDEQSLQGLLRKVKVNVHAARDWKAFEAQFESVHQNFLRAIAGLCPTLSRTELRVCALLKLNMSSKEVADILSISVRTAENHRYKIRKKLGLSDDVNVSTYLAALGG